MSETAESHEEAEVCCICSNAGELSKTKCGHSLHMHCMLEWAENRIGQHAATTCPICREVLLPAGTRPGVPTVNVSAHRIIRTGHHPVLQPLLNASVHEEIDAMVSMLLRNVNSTTPVDNMMDAVCSGDAGAVEGIIIESPDIVNTRREDGSVFLQHAVYRNHVHVLDLLLANDANPRLCDRFGVTALHAAVTVGSVMAARRLLARGACVEAADASGETSLFYAVRAKDAAMVSLLLRKKADVDAINGMGNTVLHLLAHGDHPHNITALLKQAKPRCLGKCNYIGDTPLHIAVENCNLDFIKKFKSVIPFHSRFTANHIGFSAEDYVENHARFDGIRNLFTHWQRPAHEAGSSDDGDEISVSIESAGAVGGDGLDVVTGSSSGSETSPDDASPAIAP